MTPLRLATLAAVAAALIWALRGVVIAIAGGLGRSPLEGPLFVAGLVLFAIGSTAVGVELAGDTRTAVRAAGAVGGLALGAVVYWVVSTVVGALVPGRFGWVQAESGLWAVGLFSSAVLGLWLARQEHHHSRERAA
jgi:hypothetical protein